MSTDEITTVSSMVPIVTGSRSQRELTRPNTAAVANNRLNIARVLMRALLAFSFEVSLRVLSYRKDQRNVRIRPANEMRRVAVAAVRKQTVFSR